MKRLFSGVFLCATSPRRFVRERIKLPLAKFVYDTVDLYKSRTKKGVNNLREILFRGSIVALLTALIVWLSIFMYVAFYYVYVPTITHEKPVYLTFRWVKNTFFEYSLILEYVFRPCEHWDVQKGICSFPSGSVHFNHKQQSLMAGQPYKVFLELVMPESPTNKDLGEFRFIVLQIYALFICNNDIVYICSMKQSWIHMRIEMIILFICIRKMNSDLKWHNCYKYSL